MIFFSILRKNRLLMPKPQFWYHFRSKKRQNKGSIGEKFRVKFHQNLRRFRTNFDQFFGINSGLFREKFRCIFAPFRGDFSFDLTSPKEQRGKSKKYYRAKPNRGRWILGKRISGEISVKKRRPFHEVKVRMHPF